MTTKFVNIRISRHKIAVSNKITVDLTSTGKTTWVSPYSFWTCSSPELIVRAITILKNKNSVWEQGSGRFLILTCVNIGSASKIFEKLPKLPKIHQNADINNNKKQCQTLTWVQYCERSIDATKASMDPKLGNMYHDIINNVCAMPDVVSGNFIVFNMIMKDSFAVVATTITANPSMYNNQTAH